MKKRILTLMWVAVFICACNTRASQSGSNRLGEAMPEDSDNYLEGALQFGAEGSQQTDAWISLGQQPLNNTLTLLFVGDLMQHQSQIDAALQPDGTYNYDGCFRYVSPIIKSADVAIANLEVTLAGEPYSGYPRFCAPDDYLLAIKNAGFHILLTANNHSCDTGQKGIERTIHLLDSLQIPHLGTYLNSYQRAENYPYILEKQGFRIALLNYTYGTNGLPVPAPNIVNLIDTAQILADITDARQASPDAIIALMHWGTEYRLQPDDSQKQMASWLLRHGVTHIIGNHPHVVEPIEVITDTNGEKHVVVWSLGNFLSGMKAPNTDGGLMVWLTLEKKPAEPEAFVQPAKPTEHVEPLGIHLPITLKDAEYSLVWVSRPALGSRKEYRLYPSDIPSDSLNINEKAHMQTFLSSARALFSKYNTGIKENLNPSRTGKHAVATEK